MCWMTSCLRASAIVEDPAVTHDCRKRAHRLRRLGERQNDNQSATGRWPVPGSTGPGIRWRRRFFHSSTAPAFAGAATAAARLSESIHRTPSPSATAGPAHAIACVAATKPSSGTTRGNYFVVTSSAVASSTGLTRRAFLTWLHA